MSRRSMPAALAALLCAFTAQAAQAADPIASAGGGTITVTEAVDDTSDDSIFFSLASRCPRG